MRTTVVHCKKEPFDIYIGRACRGFMESKWANPYHIGKDGNRKEVLNKYKKHLSSRPDLLKSLGELKNKKLGCWCSPEKCHGDILAQLADQYGGA